MKHKIISLLLFVLPIIAFNFYSPNLSVQEVNALSCSHSDCPTNGGPGSCTWSNGSCPTDPNGGSCNPHCNDTCTSGSCVSTGTIQCTRCGNSSSCSKNAPAPSTPPSTGGSCDSGCGTCGYRKSDGSCSSDNKCCHRTCSGSSCVTVSGGGSNSCDPPSCGGPPPTPTFTPTPTLPPKQCGETCSSPTQCALGCPVCLHRPGDPVGTGVCAPVASCESLTVSNTNPSLSDTITFTLKVKNPTNSSSEIGIYNMDNQDPVYNVPKAALIPAGGAYIKQDTVSAPPISYLSDSTDVSPDSTQFKWDVQVKDLYKPDANFGNKALEKIQFNAAAGGMPGYTAACVVQLALKVPPPSTCNTSCTDPSQCNINCPICSPNPNGSGSVCKTGCGQPCSPGNGTNNPTCDFSCPLCVPDGNGGGTCAAPPTPTPTKIPCGQSCSPGDGTNNPSCDLSCPLCVPNGNGGGTCSAPPTPTPTPVACNQSCTNPTQCNINCPVCAPNPNGSGSVCKAGCGSPCTNPSQCTFDCPICTAGGTCAAPTPTPIPCGQSCNPVGPGVNTKCDVTCPICAPDGAGGGKCVAPTPTPIPCGQSCSPEGPGVNPKCDVTCPVCAKGPAGSIVCVLPTPMPTPICGI